MIVLAGFSLISLTTSALGDARDTLAAQVLHNTVKLSPSAGKPALEDIALWKKLGRTSAGVGYRTKPVVSGEGEKRVASTINIAFIDAASFKHTRAMFADGLLRKDASTGGEIFVGRPPERPDAAPSVTYLLYENGVQLALMCGTSSAMDSEAAVKLTIKRFRFLVAEARRLKLLKP